MLFKDQLFRHKASGKRIRILTLEREIGVIWTFDIDAPTALPHDYDASELQAAIDAGDFVEIQGAPNKSVIDPTERAVARRDEAFNCIEPLVGTNDIFHESRRSLLVLQRAEELNCSPQTIYRYLRAWWRNGQTRNALTPAFHRSGGSGQTSGRGRKPVYESRSIYQVTAADQKHIRRVMKLYYLKDSAITLDQTYQRLLERHYSFVDSEGRRRLRAPGELPSLTQFRYFVRKQYPREGVLRARNGDANFELTQRPKLGSLRQQTYTVADVFEIDATVIDVLLVHDEDRSKIIGKPTAYTIRDRKSGLFVGFGVSLENPSWLAALHAIKTISEDKAELCARYGVTYDPADWPAHCVFPKTFVADRGPEMLSGYSTQLADGLEVTVQNLPARRGDWKPIVECGFKQVQRPMTDCVPGYTPPEEFGKRQSRDRSATAALPPDQFTGVFLNAIIRANRAPIKDYPMTPELILGDIQPTAVRIWNHEIRSRAGLPCRYTEEQVRFALLPRTKASVTREGITLGICSYSAPEAIARGWFVAAARGRFEVTVSYDRRLVDTIYIHDDRDPTRPFVGQLLDRCSHFRGKSFAEVEILDHLAKCLQHEGQHAKRQLTSDFHGHVDPVSSAAAALSKSASKGKSRSARKKDTVAAREDVLRRQRQTEARLTPKPPPETPSAEVIALRTAPPPVSAAVPAPASGITARQQLFEEILNGR